MAQADLLSIVSPTIWRAVPCTNDPQRPYLTGPSRVFDLTLVTLSILRIWARAWSSVLNQATQVFG